MTISSPRQQAPSARSLVLHPRPPFRLDFTVWALRRRALNEVDAWDGSTYRRVLLLDGMPVDMAVTQQGAAEAPALQVTLSSAGDRKNERAEARVALVIDHPAFTVEPWALRETEPLLDVLAQAGSVFALANGHIGLRGNLDEGEPNGLPGSYLNGFYEARPLPYAEAGYGYPEAGQMSVVRLVVFLTQERTMAIELALRRP